MVRHKLLRSILAFLDTRSWTTPRIPTDSADVGSDDKAEIREAMEYIVTLFREPLEAKSASIFSLQDEIDKSKPLIFTGTTLKIKLKITEKCRTNSSQYNVHDARKWPNVILVSKLLFSLPYTNSRVESVFYNED